MSAQKTILAREENNNLFFIATENHLIMIEAQAAKKTGLLNKSQTSDLLSQITYLPVPDQTGTFPSEKHPVWRICFEIGSETIQYLGLDVNGEISLGRGIDAPDLVDLTPYEAEHRGVSRQHATLRPTPNNLYLIDFGSTNGTLRNDRSIGTNTPYALADNDRLTLGHLEMKIQIVERPYLQTTPLKQKPDLVDALSQIASAITSQLNLEEVMNQVAATAMSLTAAGETTIWLVDENSGELFLEAELGIDDARLRRTRMPIREDTPAGQVISTGKPVRTHRQPGQEKPQLMTGYLVEALAFVPITLGGVTFGVLSAVHHKKGQLFDAHDEQLLSAIADFAAIAIQNARLYQATDDALAQRLTELTALNEVSRSVSASLDLQRVYEVLVTQVNKNWPVEQVHIYVVDTLLKALRPLHWSASNEILYPLDQGIIGKVALSGVAIVTNDITTHPDYDAAVDHINGSAPGSLACVPLKIKNDVVGTLALFNKEDGIFADEDVTRLEAFANPVATAVENARLFEESERQRAAIQATAHTLSEPLIVLDHNGMVLVANDAANVLLESNMSQMFEAISRGVGMTTEVKIKEETYLTTTEHVVEVGTIIVMQNITYVKRLEKDRSEFMHMLSHDLKNPLTAINGWSSLLERTAELDDKGQRFLQEINVAADRMLEMINQLLQTVSQDDSMILKSAPCDLQEIINRVMQDVEGVALQKSIQISYTCQGQPFDIGGDRIRLYHMILNLLDNALKYSGSGTRIDIVTSYAPDWIRIVVKDNGPGIPKKDLPHVFDKYYRGIQDSLQALEGTGVGLAAVKNIAESHGGSIFVRNGEQRGAIFTIKLPGGLRIDHTKM
ncbi:MAG: GAF domain-containing protein [Chloroflexi bacterium]|nr:GAF domain-containing protein [Chloroflexota bacterium]